MRTMTNNYARLIFICISALLLALVASSIGAESVINQDADTAVEDRPKYDEEINSAALPDDIRKAVVDYLAQFAPNKDFEHYEWQNPEIVKFAKVAPTERMRRLIRPLIPGKVDPKEIYCVTCQADEVCKKAHTEFKSCDVASIDDRVVPLGFREEITAGKKSRTSFNWILARVESGRTYIVNFAREPDEPNPVKNAKWTAVCPYEQILIRDRLKKKAAEEEECKKWLKTNPDFLKKKLGQEGSLAKMLAQPGKSFKGYHDIIEKLGKPKTVNMKKVPNKYHPSAEDTIKTLTYPGLVVEVYQVPKFKKEFIISLAVTKRQDKLRLPVTVGASRDFVLSRLGEPPQDDGDALTYGNDYVDLKIGFKDSKVSRIEWYYNPN